MRLIFFILALTVSCICCQAQVTDDFSDGDFTSGIAWSGDSSEFIVNASYQLQLNNTAAGISHLSIPNPVSSLNNIQWVFYIRQAFSPSSSNCGRVYLASDEGNLEGSLNGYYLQFGESGSSDAVKLFRQAGSISTLVAIGTIGEISTSFALGVKVTRDVSGNWSLYIDPSGGMAYALEATGEDTAFTTTNYFGVLAVYTLSNATKFYFDDFYIGPIIVDTIPPVISSSTVISGTQIDILFSENIDPVSSQMLVNYSADNGLGNPISAIRDGSNNSLVHLSFAPTFTGGLLNTLTITNVEDLNGNAIISETTSFIFTAPVTAAYKDIIINEIMADPTPLVALPTEEFIEIYNKSAHAFNLNDWKLTDGSSSATLGNYTLLPGGYLIICATPDTSLFMPFGSCMGVTNFPSMNNSGDNLKLENNTSEVIDSVYYSDDWYHDAIKKEGGWTLELIYPDAPLGCSVPTNWAASENSSGGTPGVQNSIYSLIGDTTSPIITSVTVVDSVHIIVCFSEALDMSQLAISDNYNLGNGIGVPLTAMADASHSCVNLSLGSPLLSSTRCSLTVNNIITDCAGNTLGVNNTAYFTIPEPALPNDIVINEILFDPNEGGVDFVEIYNRSNKIINLQTMTLSQYDTINNVLLNTENVSNEDYFIFPEDYLVLSESGKIVKSQYNTINPEKFLDMNNVPNMNIAGGTICLATSAAIIDKFKYDPGMHFGLLNKTKGVSLERVDFDRPTQDRSNWHSAAEAVGFATPAYENSQYNPLVKGDNVIQIIPEIFSPDEDGYNDIVNISYQFDTPGFLANVSVHDSKGRLVKSLVRNQLLATNGTFSWDGIDDNREKGRIGIYIIFFEAFDLSGNVKHYKKTCVLAGKL